jgi:hypothetical protein
MRRFLNLSPTDRRLLLEAMLVVPLARFASLYVLLAMVARPRHAPDAVRSGRIAWAANAVDSRLPHSTCLTRALAASLLFTLHGHPATVRLGVARDDGELAAHAWLESDGRIVIGEMGTFTALR